MFPTSCLSEALENRLLSAIVRTYHAIAANRHRSLLVQRPHFFGHRIQRIVSRSPANETIQRHNDAWLPNLESIRSVLVTAI